MKIKNYILGLSAAAVLAVSCTQAPAEADITMQNETDSISCALGFVLADGLNSQLKQQFDTINGKALVAALAQSSFSDDYKSMLKNSFDTIDFALAKSAFVNHLAYGKADFDQASANQYLQSAYQRNQMAKDMQPGKPAFENKKKGDEFLAENGKKDGIITTESGLQYEVIKEGSGEKPTADSRVSVLYEGKLLDGKVFDSSLDKESPAQFGVGQVIPGWTEGLQLMSKGAKYKFYIPAELAYGQRGAGNDIGPMETLIFEVELLDIVKE